MMKIVAIRLIYRGLRFPKPTRRICSSGHACGYPKIRMKRFTVLARHPKPELR